MDDDIPAEHVRAAQLGYVVALRMLREDDFAYDDGEGLLDEMVQLAGSAKKALGLMLTSMGVMFRHIEDGDKLLERMIDSLAAKSSDDGNG